MATFTSEDVQDDPVLGTREGARKIHRQPLRRRLRPTSLLRSIAAAIILAIFVIPFAWMFLSSFKSQTQIFNDVYPLSIWTLLPRSWTLANFHQALVNQHLARALVNTAIVSVSQVVLTLLVCSLAAFAFSKFRWRGPRLAFGLALLSLMIPLEAIVVPLYQVVSHLGITNSYSVVFLPWVASPFALFLLRQTFDDLPQELIEAALVDGASYFRIFWTIAMPLIKPALATVALLTFVDGWNSFLWPLISLSDPSKQVVSVAIAQTSVPGALPNWGVIFAGASAATIPVLLLFIFLQRYFIEGISFSGLKG
jgi:multiple sugar transport system permease protein/putative chitobiose transport system permease protein